MSTCCQPSVPKPPPAAGVCCCPCACGGAPTPPWQSETVSTPVGEIPRVRTSLTLADQFGAVRVRSNIGRMNYKVDPGLYAVGTPGADAPVLVTANYKLTFDRVRQELGGLNLWLLVLDTDGINVWCAAGKGSFGTAELVRRLAVARLPEIVRHRTLILPQLGAPGVAAHTVLKQSGFKVVYGPVYARDLPAFLAAGLRATPAMRRVHFNLAARLAVVPVELAMWGKQLLALAALLMLVAVLAAGADWQRAGGIAGLAVAAFLTGGVIAPVLLPWLPGRAFAVKGAVAGIILAAGLHFSGIFGGVCGVRNGWETAAWWLLLPAISAYMTLNFTGTATFTSPSGVKRELRIAIPVLLVAAIAGLALFVTAQFVGR